MPSRSWWVAAVALTILVAASTGRAHDPEDVPGPAPMEFVPPAPGSYVLHAIMRAPEGRVLDLNGRPHAMSRFTSGKITLLGFIYTSCADAGGCPLAYQVFHTIHHRLSEQGPLGARVRLVSLSFDPARDTPARMRAYAAGRPIKGVEWNFLTTESPQRLLPLLDGFGQDVRINANGGPGPLAHTLKAFLIDTRGVVREIYTTSYLYPDVILNDIATLRMEEAQAPDSRDISPRRPPKDTLLEGIRN